jgi:hypothetical protein
MAKILGAEDTGFGILIESDAGYMSKELNPTLLKEGVEVSPDKPVLINCVLQKWGVKNRNGRIYPKDVLMKQVDEYQKLASRFISCFTSQCFSPNKKNVVGSR